ncbi:hypothetical protein [Burkholderia sp. HI2500]|uniref:hypothetical protein n=1 Tax=Burkholderia sp. HI2500 TaxID=2015358 RepID=UPI00117F4A66|nr:hypothetical protein [Burkholderia sp. HI2500]
MTDLKIGVNDILMIVRSDGFMKPSAAPNLNIPSVVLHDKVALLQGVSGRSGGDEASDFGWREWVELKENISLPIQNKFYGRDDLDVAKWGGDVDRLGDEILSRLDPQGLRLLVDEILQDFTVLMMLPSGEREVDSLFYAIFASYQQGYLPCGWDGSYPVGRLKLFGG